MFVVLTFCSLELNIHQRILSDIASNVGETNDDLDYAKYLIAAKVQTRAEPDKHDEPVLKERVFMVNTFASSR
jgi:phosphatidylinositol 4-kinase